MPHHAAATGRNGHIDTDAIRAHADLLALLPPMPRVAATHGGEYAGPCPACGGTDRFRVWPRQDGGGRFWCRQCDFKGDAIDLVMRQQGVDFAEACHRLDPSAVPARKAPKARAHATPTLVDTTIFEDSRGRPRLKKERYEPGWPDKSGQARDKSFILYHADPAAPGGWAKGRPPGPKLPRALFNLKAILEAPPGSTVYFAEGELKAKRLAAAGWLATCKWEGGTAWHAAYRGIFLDQHAVIFEDHDAVGAALTARMLPDVAAVARSVRVVRFPELPAGGDVLDWLDAGHTLDELAARVAATPPEPPAAAPESAPPTEAPRFRFLSLADLATLPPPAWLVDGLIPAGGLACLYGPSGVGKSFFALDWALSVATGAGWGGRAVAAGPVVYLAAEGVAGMRARAAAWAAHTGQAAPDNFWIVPETANLLAPDTVPALLGALPTPAPALIVVDTLARSMPGGEENSAQDMGLVIAAADSLRKATGATVLLVHHTGKSGQTERGSSALRAACDTMLALVPGDGVVTLECDKQKDAEPFAASYHRLLPTADSCVVVAAAPTDRDGSGPLSPTQRAVLDILCGPVFAGTATSAELNGVDELKGRGVHRALSGLISRGLVRTPTPPKTPGRRFLATAAGWAAIERTPPEALVQLTATYTAPQAPVTASDSGLTPAPVTPTYSADPPEQARTYTSDSDLQGTYTHLHPADGTTDRSNTTPLGVRPVSPSGCPADGSDWRAQTTTPPATAPPPPDKPCERCGTWDWVWLRTGGWTCACYLYDPLPGTIPRRE